MASNDEPKEWLSLQAASDRLGVSPATLRIWADRGRVQSFRTPGGHRRFRERDLRAVVTEREPAGVDQQLRMLAHLALGRTRFEVSDGWLGGEAWYQRFPAGAREQHRDLGRRVILSLSEIMSSAEADKLLVQRASELGRTYAELNQQYGIALPDALRAFMFFRDSFIESLVELSRTSPLLDVMRLMRHTSRFVDQMLLTMVEVHLAPTPDQKAS
ncbi:MAG: helix-turn-helix domain-containing protein [Anaerolineae bacterium]